MTVVLRGGRVITAASDGVIDKGVVVIDGAHLTAVGAEGEIDVPKADARVIDVQGRTILPGLIDLHTHVCPYTDEETQAGTNARTVTQSVLRGVENIKRTVAFGITTVRDLGAKHTGIFVFKQAIDRGELVGPRIFPAGAAIAMTGGHGYNSVANEADGPEMVRALVREQFKQGAECIKIMATGGSGTPGERVVDSQLTFEEIAAAVDEAHKRGKTTAAHATYPKGILDSINAGVDTIEHGLLMDDACIRRLVETGRYYVPTLEAYQRIARLGTSVYPEYFVPKTLAVIEPHRNVFKKAVSAGVKIAAGTDSGGHFWRLGDLGIELERMVELGLEPLQAIQTATRNAAEALQSLDRFGTLEPGKLADVIVVDGDPLSDIRTLRSVWLVMKEGQVQLGGA